MVQFKDKEDERVIDARPERLATTDETEQKLMMRSN